MDIDGGSYNNCILTTELPEGLSFAKDEDIRTVSETIECIDDTNANIELTYPVHIIADDYTDKFEIMLSLTADGYEEPQTYSKSFEVSLEKEENTILIFTTEKSLSVKTGDSMWLAFGLLDTEANQFSEWKKMAIVVSDPSVIELSDYKETEYGYSLEVIGKKKGSTNVVITDASSGTSITIQISVYDEYVQKYSYAIDNMPSFYPETTLWESLIETNIYNMNGLYVNNYSAEKNNNTNKYMVSFDVYNSKHYYGAVDIYDQNGNWIDYEEIKKFSDITSLWETGEQAFCLITDTFLTSKLLTYEQASFSECTHVSFEVPENGYFTISNNVATSPGTYFANAFEILFDAATTALDLAMADSIKNTAFDKFAAGTKQELMERMVSVLIDNTEVKENIQKSILGTLESQVRTATKKLAKAEFNYIIPTANDMYSSLAGLTEDFMGTINTKMSWKQTFQMATGFGESVFAKLSGPVGIALKGCFALNKGSNKLIMAVQMATSTDNTYAKVLSNMGDCSINQNGVVINHSGNIDSEAVLQVFRISNNDTVEVILDSDNPLETYELYNICFVKNDQLIQPNGKVTVYMPIPDGMNGSTCKVYRQEEDGAWTILDAHKERNYLVFETDHFSLYAVVGEAQNIKIYSLPTNTTYINGNTLSTDGLVIDIDGILMSEGFVCTPIVLSECGIQSITVRYGSATTEFDVTVSHIGGTADCVHKAICDICGQEYGGYGVHSYSDKINEVSAACKVEGMKAHYKCLVCNKLFDENMAVTTEDALVVPALNHILGEWHSNGEMHWKECINADCGEIDESTKGMHTGGTATCSVKAACSVCNQEYGSVNANNHINTEVRNAVAATTENEGYSGDVWCTDCSTKIANGTIINKLEHIHVMTYHEAVKATCAETGSVKYWTCSNNRCSGIYYANKEGSEILTNITILKDADNHVGGTEIQNVKEATIEQEGYSGDKICLGCGAVVETGKIIPAIGTNNSNNPPEHSEPVQGTNVIQNIEKVKSEPIYYIVARGDTLNRIARRQGISLAQLLTWNPQIRNIHRIFPGQKIVIGYTQGNETAQMQQDAVFVVVQRGDSLYAIARRNRVPLGIIVYLNPQIAKQKYIYCGQRIRIR